MRVKYDQKEEKIIKTTATIDCREVVVKLPTPYIRKHY